MEQFLEIIKQPFVWGLLIGLGLAFFAWKSGLTTRSRLSRDMRRLENELSEHAWLIADPHPDIIFGDAHSKKWELTLGMLGIDPAHLHQTGGNA